MNTLEKISLAVGVYSVTSVLLGSLVGRYLRGAMRDFPVVPIESGTRIARQGLSDASSNAMSAAS